MELLNVVLCVNILGSIHNSEIRIGTFNNLI